MFVVYQLGHAPNGTWQLDSGLLTKKVSTTDVKVKGKLFNKEPAQKAQRSPLPKWSLHMPSCKDHADITTIMGMRGGEMIDLDPMKKRHVYRTLYGLNVSFAAIVAHCRALKEAKVMKTKFARLYKAYAQELQAQINEELLETMHDIEQLDIDRFEKIRDARNKELRDLAMFYLKQKSTNGN